MKDTPASLSLGLTPTLRYWRLEMDHDRNVSWGFAHFCDDVRHEEGNKLSLMGLYQNDLIFPGTVAFPVSVPKFVILIMYYEIIGAINGDMNLHVVPTWTRRSRSAGISTSGSSEHATSSTAQPKN